MNNQLLKIAAVLAVSTGLFSCSATPKKEEAPTPIASSNIAATPQKAPAEKTPAETRPATDAVRVDSTALSLANIDQSGNILCQRSTYFDFDKQTVKSDYLPAIQAHGQLLGKERGAKVLIQGNTDDRGSREYNLALGQRRADAIKEILTSAGASSGQVQTTSLGKEKPKASGHDESAWSINRRADILYGNESRVPSCSNMNP